MGVRNVGRTVGVGHARRSGKTGRLICSTCNSGYACEDPDSAYFGRCSVCYRGGADSEGAKSFRT